MAKRARQWVMTPVLGAAVAACSTEGPVDLGDGNEKDLGQNLADYAGTWKGYAEAYKFESGSDRVTLELDADGNGGLRFGDGPLWDPPSDPEVGYPPSAGLNLAQAYEDFAYPIHDSRVESGRIRMNADGWDIFKAWCDLQTPQLVVDANLGYRYSCAPSGDVNTGGPLGSCLVGYPAGPQTPIDCAKAGLCYPERVCRCTESGCEVPELEATGTAANERPLELDAALESEGADLVGTLVLPPDWENAHPSVRVAIRLKRQ